MTLIDWSGGQKNGRCYLILENVNASPQCVERPSRIVKWGTTICKTVNEKYSWVAKKPNRKVS